MPTASPGSRFDKPGTSTNVLSRDTLLELDAHLDDARSDRRRAAW